MTTTRPGSLATSGGDHPLRFLTLERAPARDSTLPADYPPYMVAWRVVMVSCGPYAEAVARSYVAHRAGRQVLRDTCSRRLGETVWGAPC